MDEINNTLYIPLYGKALVSRKGILLTDRKAEMIWEKEGFPLKLKSRSKWLAYFMAMRASIFDEWLAELMNKDEDAVILHIGCGLDGRIMRVGNQSHQWWDVDFADVILKRRQYYRETEHYHMIDGDARKSQWLDKIPKGESAIIVFEGVSMYLNPEQLVGFLKAVIRHFSSLHILMDCYTDRSAKLSKIKNPIKDVGATRVYGIDNPKVLERSTGLHFIKEHNMTPDSKIIELGTYERIIFCLLFGGRMAKSLYRMYEFRSTMVKK